MYIVFQKMKEFKNYNDKIYLHSINKFKKNVFNDKRPTLYTMYIYVIIIHTLYCNITFSDVLV